MNSKNPHIFSLERSRLGANDWLIARQRPSRPQTSPSASRSERSFSNLDRLSAKADRMPQSPGLSCRPAKWTQDRPLVVGAQDGPLVVGAQDGPLVVGARVVERLRSGLGLKEQVLPMTKIRQLLSPYPQELH